MNLNISIIIIGFNSLSTLKKLLPSIKNIVSKNINLEIIYIDDGSTDASFDYFKSYSFPFKAVSFKFENNRGRVHATDMGIQKATGDWLLFIQSNMIVDSHLLQHYANAIQSRDSNNLIIAGTIIYQSSDRALQNYLNSNSRGINAYRCYENIHFSHLLFGNCIIHNSIFKKYRLNLQLESYGGEELDFSYKVIKENPNIMIAYPDAQVTRIDFPVLQQHCVRLEEYGRENLALLDPALQKLVIRYKILLVPIPGLYYLISCLYILGLHLYKIPMFSKVIIKYILGLAILKGYYKRVK